jgi:uncharacterized protein involved in cysteine biosynthesis
VARPDLLEPPPGGAIAEASTGLRLALRGAALTLRTPRLLALVVLPLVISFLLFAGMVAAVWEYRELARPELATPWPSGLDWLRRVVAVSAEALGVIVGIGVAALATVVLSQVVNSPFLEGLSQAVETIVVGQPDRTPFTMKRLWRTTILPIFQAIGVGVAQVMLGLLFLGLSFLAITAPLAALGGLWLVALSLCDVSIARKGYPVGERFRRVRRALPHYLGLALPFFLAPFLLPLGIAGATLADLRQRRFAPRAGVIAGSASAAG